MKNIINEFLSHLKYERGYSENTVLSYRRDLCQFENYLRMQGVVSVSGISRTHISSFITRLMSIGMKASSIERHIAAIKSFFGYLISEGKLSSNPASDIELPQKGKKLPKALTQLEVSRLVETPRSAKDRAILELLYATGIRASELISMT